jgi:hypothetical protein
MLELFFQSLLSSPFLSGLTVPSHGARSSLDVNTCSGRLSAASKLYEAGVAID